MNINLTGKTALVCGGSNGIGKAIAIELALLGASCVLFARNSDKLEIVTEELDSTQGQTHSYLTADFTVVEQVEMALQKLDQPVHILVNNTGGPKGGSILEAMPSEFLNAFTQHLVINQIMVQKVVEGMKKAGYGRIVNITSTSVRVPINGLGVSNTIRGAVASWSKTLSNELAPFGITVNNVLPGSTETTRIESLIHSIAEAKSLSYGDVRKKLESEIPMQRFGGADEIAALAAFLCTPAASYITGVNVQADGGRIGSI